MFASALGQGPGRIEKDAYSPSGVAVWQPTHVVPAGCTTCCGVRTCSTVSSPIRKPLSAVPLVVVQYTIEPGASTGAIDALAEALAAIPVRAVPASTPPRTVIVMASS